MSNGELIKMIRLGEEGGCSSEMQQTQQHEPLGRIPNCTPTPLQRDQSHHSEVVKCCLKLVHLSFLEPSSLTESTHCQCK